MYSMATKEAGMSNTMVIALVVLILILVSNVLVYKLAKAPDTKAMEQAVKIERERLEKDWDAYKSEKETLLVQKDNALYTLRQKHNKLLDAINKRAKESESIKAPVTNKELRERFTGLGYPPK